MSQYEFIYSCCAIFGQYCTCWDIHDKKTLLLILKGYVLHKKREVNIFDDNIKTQKEEYIFDDKQDTDKYPTVKRSYGIKEAQKEVENSATVAAPPPELSEDEKVKVLNRCMTRCYSALTGEFPCSKFVMMSRNFHNSSRRVF